MSHLQPTGACPAPFQCRFEMAADAPCGREFCVFEFPGCEGCPNALHTPKTMADSKDPLKTAAWQGWLALNQVLLKLLAEEEAKDLSQGDDLRQETKN